MTVIVYRVVPDRVLLLTDTNVVDGAGRSVRFADKVELVPCLDAVLLTTGDGEHLQAWTRRVRSSLVRDVDELDELAPSMLSELWERLGCAGRGSEFGSDIYAFGWSPTAGGFVGFKYASARGFESVRCPEGAVGIRPAPRFGDYAVDSLKDWVALAVRLRDEYPAIAGDLMLTTLTPGSVSVTRLYRFDDFDARWASMLGAGELVSR